MDWGAQRVSRSELYNEPRYYDIAFGWDIGPEMDFLAAVFQHHARIPVTSVVDLACGTGRFTLGLAQRGLDVSGVDLSREMLSYAFDRGKDQGVLMELFLKDIRDFQLYRKFTGAVCMTGSFAYLHPDAAVRDHLNRVSEHLRQGGVYVIDATVVTGETDLLPPPQEWAMSRDRIRVTTRWELSGEYSAAAGGLVTETLWLTGEERGWQRSWSQESQVRIYRPGELKALLERSGQFALVGAYAAFDLDQPYWDAEGRVLGGHRMLVVLVKTAADVAPPPRVEEERPGRRRPPGGGRPRRDGSRGRDGQSPSTGRGGKKTPGGLRQDEARREAGSRAAGPARGSTAAPGDAALRETGPSSRTNAGQTAATDPAKRKRRPRRRRRGPQSAAEPKPDEQ